MYKGDTFVEIDPVESSRRVASCLLIIEDGKRVRLMKEMERPDNGNTEVLCGD